MSKRKISTHTPSEERVGYSRAIVVDDKRLYISGTTSVNVDGVVQGTTMYEQADFILNTIESVAIDAGFIKEDIVMLRVYLVDMDNLPQFDQAFKEHFGEINPACTLVGISDLVDEGLLIEIECIAEKSA